MQSFIKRLRSNYQWSWSWPLVKKREKMQVSLFFVSIERERAFILFIYFLLTFVYNRSTIDPELAATGRTVDKVFNQCLEGCKRLSSITSAKPSRSVPLQLSSSLHPAAAFSSITES